MGVWDEIKKQDKLLLSLVGIGLLVVGMYTFQDELWGNFGGVVDTDIPSDEEEDESNDDDLERAYELNPAERDGMYDEPRYVELDEDVNYLAKINTTYGTIVIELYEEETPKTVRNFIFLARDGFYNDLVFHRVIRNFMIQTGDPLGQGFGGPGYTFEDEIVEDLKFGPYVVAMANSGPNTNGSQFFITTEDSNTDHLNGAHTIFGRVIRGYSVVDQIEDVDTDENDRPWQNVRIKSVEVVERGFLQDIFAGYWWIFVGLLMFAVGVVVMIVVRNSK